MFPNLREGVEILLVSSDGSEIVIDSGNPVDFQMIERELLIVTTFETTQLHKRLYSGYILLHLVCKHGQD